MYRKLTLVLAILVIAPAGSVLAAGPKKENSTPAPDRQASDATTAPRPDNNSRAVDRATLSPMHQEILTAVDDEHAKVEALSARFVNAVSLDEKIAIQKEIEGIKKAGQIMVFEIQLRYAREAGRTDVVKELENVIEAVKNPKMLKASGEKLLAPGK